MYCVENILNGRIVKVFDNEADAMNWVREQDIHDILFCFYDSEM